MPVHGEIWTIKELFVYPNENIVWSIQIVLYPYLTGLVAGAFVLSSLSHVFGKKELKPVTPFALVFSLALLLAAPLPLLFHLQQPQRNVHVLFTPHFTSAIAAFGVVFSVYAAIVASEVWFTYRKYIVESALALRKAEGLSARLKGLLYRVLTLGSYDVSEKALKLDERAATILAGVGIPVACFLHGYVGFIFGSVKANALWMTPLMPVIFIMSAVVSGIALCLFTYIMIMEIRVISKRPSPWGPAAGTPAAKPQETDIQIVRIMGKYLVFFMILALTLELLDLVFHGYTAKKNWEILQTVIFDRFAFNIFGLQYGLGMVLPFLLLLLPRLSVRRAFVASCLILFGVFMMRWNVVIGGQAFSLTFSGYMNYQLPIVPHDLETFKEGLAGFLLLLLLPFGLLALFSRFLPLFPKKEKLSPLA
ncbi:MAG: polysulfide reductase NrfD [Nitrospirae bacterium]|nr:polysulfide reductase NrfD [Nitrospirota bacterium]